MSFANGPCNYFYILKFCPIYVLFLVLLVCLCFLCSPSKCISPSYHESHFSICNSGSVFSLHCPIFCPI